jgi:hypothetical protein
VKARDAEPFAKAGLERFVKARDAEPFAKARVSNVL